MPNQILQVDENMLETKLDRLVSEKVEQLLNAMLDAEADEIPDSTCKCNGWFRVGLF
ncbi:transposase [Bifidobacterium longum subsp. longum]|nr:transposase [Bifidobacterium longum subsp. longum]